MFKYLDSYNLQAMIPKAIFTALILSSLILCVHLTNLKNQLTSQENKKWFKNLNFRSILSPDPNLKYKKKEVKGIFEHGSSKVNKKAITWDQNANSFFMRPYQNPGSHLRIDYLLNRKVFINNQDLGYICRSPEKSNKSVTPADCSGKERFGKYTQLTLQVIEYANPCVLIQSHQRDYLTYSGERLYWDFTFSCFSIHDVQ